MISVIAALVLSVGAMGAITEAEAATAPSATAASEDDKAATGDRSRSLLQSAAEGLQRIKNLRADFTQVAPSGSMNTGTLYIARPGRLRFEFDEPNPTLLVATGGLVYVHDSDLQTTDSYPVGQTPLRFLLTKELDLEAAQVLSVHEGEHGLKITLAAKDEDLQGHLALVFDPQDLTLEGWSFVAPNGEVTLVDLENVTEVKRLPGRLFRVPEAGGRFLRDQ